MILIEEYQTHPNKLPIEHFKAHLHLGSGFSEDAVQDQVLEGYLRAAISAIEGRTGQALYGRDFEWSLGAWQSQDSQQFPLSPVRTIYEIKIVKSNGDEISFDVSQFQIVTDSMSPVLRSLSGSLPTIPEGGKAVVRMYAGSAEQWSDVPPDLAQAVLLMAAHYYEYRSDLSLSRGCTPFGVTALIERYRTIRISMRGTA